MVKQWTMQITSPSGEIYDMGSLDRASSTVEHSVAFYYIKRFLEGCNLTQRELLLADLPQMLLNGNLMQFHGYRLAWGESDPLQPHAAYPDGVSTEWVLYRFINGERKVVISGSLPDNWWAIEDYQKDLYVEKLYAE